MPIFTIYDSKDRVVACCVGFVELGRFFGTTGTVVAMRAGDYRYHHGQLNKYHYGYYKGYNIYKY